MWIRTKQRQHLPNDISFLYSIKSIKSQRYSKKHIFKFGKKTGFWKKRLSKGVARSRPPEPLLPDPVSILRRLGRWSQERLVWGGWCWWLVAEVRESTKGIHMVIARGWHMREFDAFTARFFDEWWSQRTRMVLTKRSTDNKEDRDKLLKFQLFRQWNDLIGRGK